MIRIFSYSQYHNKNPVVGSTYIRVNQLIKYWPEAGLYVYGENPEVLIFQKVYCQEDYKFPLHFKGIKILDICDPDWLDGMPIKETCDCMDAVVCPTEGLAKFLRQLHPHVRVIKDRFDMELIPTPKEHTEEAKTVVWFGYRHNAEVLKPALNLINELGLKLLIISDDDPLAWQWIYGEAGDKFREKYTYKKYQEDTIYETLKLADFCLLPIGTRPQDVYKSENKTVKAILAGLPVAKDGDDVRNFIDPKNRVDYLRKYYNKTKAGFNVNLSIKEYQELIDEIKNK